VLHRLPVTAAVLAGGRSRRMGLDKALLRIGGRTLVARVAEAVGAVCAHVLVVTNRPDALADAGLPADVSVVGDEVPHLGPLGGLVAALTHAQDPWILAVAADMPWIQPEVIRLLWERRADADAVVPVGDNGPEPLLALYSRRCLPTAQRLLDEGHRRPADLLDAVQIVEVPLDDLRAADPDLRSFENVNTPEELAEAQHANAASAGRAVRITAIGEDRRHPGGLPVERQVTIYAGGTEIATVQASPGHLDELAVGFLVSEGLITDRDGLDAVEVDGRRGLVFVKTSEAIDVTSELRTRYFTSGCGKGVTFASVGHAKDLVPVRGALHLRPEAIATMMAEMGDSSAAHKSTGGMHACALATGGAVVIVREDIGRHNALDKVLGRAWLDGVPTEDSVILTTGRISYEMVIKAARASAPIVVSAKAVTDLAAEIADVLGITVVGYARGGGMTVYTHAERIDS